MGTVTPQMSLQKPTLGGDPLLWDDQLNASLDLLDTHDHSSGKGVKITPAGININAALTFAGFGATNLARAGFTNQAASPGNLSLWTKTSDNELYFTTSGGTDIKLTSGTGLNMSLVGGITGDYAAVGAEFYYDDASATYRALRDTPLPNDWASISCGDVDLYEKASGIANRVRLKSPASLALSYTLTLPAGLPGGGATGLLQSSSSGTMSFNATGSRAPMFATTLECNSTVSLGTLVAAFTATGAITATDFKHSAVRKQHIPAAAMRPIGSGVVFFATGSEIHLDTHTGGTDTPSVVIPIVLDQGMQITAVRILLINDSAGSPVGRLKSRSGATVNSIANASASASEINLTGLTTTVAAGTHYWAQVEGIGSANDRVLGAEISYTRP